MFSNSVERKYVKRIYVLLFSMLLINPLLCNFIHITTILRSMELLCYIGIFFYKFKLYKNNCIRCLYGYEKFLYVILFLISIGIIVRGDWPTSPKDIALHVLVAQTYILPFIIVTLPNEEYFSDIIKLFFKISLFVIPLWIINVSDLVQVGTYKAEGIGAYLPFLSAFVLGLGVCLNGRQRKVNFVIWAVYFILMMLNARRNVSFSLLLYAFIAYIFVSYSSLKKNMAKFIFIALVSILTLLILMLNMDSLTSGLFSNIAGRLNENTRSGVEELFFADFATSPTSDWLFGRGMDGGYYQVETNEETGEISDNRQVIETGYLQLMLKGGIIYDVVVILFMLTAVVSGFKQHNGTIYYITVILMTYFIDLYTTNPVCLFSVRSILFWFCISILLNCKNQKRKKSYSLTL